jgi:hypothetical protein
MHVGATPSEGGDHGHGKTVSVGVLEGGRSHRCYSGFDGGVGTSISERIKGVERGEAVARVYK